MSQCRRLEEMILTFFKEKTALLLMNLGIFCLEKQCKFDMI